MILLDFLLQNLRKNDIFITTDVELESGSGRGVQHYVIKFVSDLRQVGGFLRFPPPLKLTATNIFLQFYDPGQISDSKELTVNNDTIGFFYCKI
jgi:hypothetical protein